jgi:hypothetical protein
MIDNGLSVESGEQKKPLVDAPSPHELVSKVIVFDAHETTDSINVVLKIGTVVDAVKRHILESTWAFIEASGDKKWEDLVKHREAYGTLISACTDSSEWPWMHIISKRLLETEHRIRIEIAKNELEKSHPNLVALLYCMKLASDSSIPFSGSISHELTELNAEITRRGFDIDIQDRMSVLSSTVGELIPYVGEKFAEYLRLVVEALGKNAPLYVDNVKKLVTQTRGFALKQNEDRGSELCLIADRMEAQVQELEGVEK